MEIVKQNVASIAPNEPEGEHGGDRVILSIASEYDDGQDRTVFFITTDQGEDTGPTFDTIEKAEKAIYDMWGDSPVWDLQYTPKPKMLMNPFTGSVDTAENWMADMKDWGIIDGITPEQQFAKLEEVIQDEQGNWIPAK